MKEEEEEEKSPAPSGIRAHDLKSYAPQACALPLCYNSGPGPQLNQEASGVGPKGDLAEVNANAKVEAEVKLSH